MNIPSTLTKNTEDNRETASANLSDAQEPMPKQRLNFSDNNHAAHVQALLEWLPKELHGAPNITWERVPGRVIGYLVRTVGASPDAPYIAFAVGAMLGAMSNEHLRNLTTDLHTLLKDLRHTCAIEHLSQLADKQVWITFATQRTLSQADAKHLLAYVAITDQHTRHHLEELDAQQRVIWQSYALPCLPVNFVKQYHIREILDAQSQERRKAQSDVLTPLYPALVQIVQFRKQAAQRLLHAFREAQKRVEAGEVDLPYSFVHEDTIPSVNRDARTVADIKIVGRKVAMHLTLWDRRTWMREHAERYQARVLERVERGAGAYGPERKTLFLQFTGPEAELLWFGDLVKYRLLQRLNKRWSHTADYQERRQYADDLGEIQGYGCARTGLLGPGGTEGMWLSSVHQPGDMLFEPISLYRGVLYGAALATLALTNGSRVSELLQVSDDRWETIVVDQLKDGRPTGRKETIIVQRLLPKGMHTDAQRQLFLLSKQAVRLLKEIYEGLIATHREVPVVAPNRNNGKYEDLHPERYLFQWDASADGQLGTLSREEVTRLLRFVLHGLELSTAKGDPIVVSTHLLRHVTATHIRHYHRVPPEAIALLLHHRMFSDQSDHLSISAATRYYSQLPHDRQIALLHSLQVELDSLSAKAVIYPPTERDLEQMNDDMQAVFERWGTILPTAFGNCGCSGLCIREDQRSLCIGCSYLVVDPAKMENALKWRNVYAKQADDLEAEGNYRDAKQKRRLVQQLDGHINMMHLQQQAEEEGRSFPFLKSSSLSQG